MSTLFVLVEPDGYSELGIRGISLTLANAVELATKVSLQKLGWEGPRIEEVPIDSPLIRTLDQVKNTLIDGAIAAYDLGGNSLNT
jgi:hypothetical protein